MVIQSNGLPFTVTFVAVKGSRDAVSVSFFTESEDELLAKESPGVELIENTEYELLFESRHPEAQLFLDVLDALPIRSPLVQISTDDAPYVTPGNEPIPLYFDGYIPWIPGLYHFCVRLREKVYYSSIRIRPKLMGDTELDIMRSELQDEVRGLAYQLVRRQLTLGHAIEDEVPGLDILQFHVIMRHADTLTAAALDLMARANHGIVKRYERVPADGSAEVDEWSVRQMLQKPPARGLVLTPRRVTSHDRLENRWVVFVTERILRSLDQMLHALRVYVDQLRHDVSFLAKYAEAQRNAAHERERKAGLLRTVEKYAQTTHRVTQVLRMLQTASWYQSIRSEVMRKGRPAFSHVLVSDSRYRAFYQVYRELNSDDLKIDISTRYALQWRPTSQLYEMWGFIKVLKHLTMLEFVPVKGWFYEGYRGGSQLYVDEMRSGVTLTLVRGDVRLRLVYDGEIPTRVHQTTLEQPIYTMNRHNRPDGRMDVYKQGVYFGSLVFDFKYRPIRNFWNLSADPSKWPREMDQICGYQGGCRSKFLYGTHDTPVATWPVREVWAIHPSGDEPVEEIEDYAVKLVRLNPGHDNRHLSELLAETIDRILEGEKRA
jgi:hypothetical protein